MNLTRRLLVKCVVLSALLSGNAWAQLNLGLGVENGPKAALHVKNNGPLDSFIAGEGLPLGSPIGTPSAIAHGLGVLNGTYEYAYTEQAGFGETTLSAIGSASVTDSTIRVMVPVPRRGVSQRKLYRKNPDDAAFRLVHTFGGSYFATLWDDNVPDATVHASPMAPTVDTSELYSVSLNSGVKIFRTHPDQGVSPADLTVITGNPLVSGAYAMDVYGTVFVRAYVGDSVASQRVDAQPGYHFVAYERSALDDDASPTEVFSVGNGGVLTAVGASRFTTTLAVGGELLPDSAFSVQSGEPYQWQWRRTDIPADAFGVASDLNGIYLKDVTDNRTLINISKTGTVLINENFAAPNMKGLIIANATGGFKNAVRLDSSNVWQFAETYNSNFGAGATFNGAVKAPTIVITPSTPSSTAACTAGQLYVDTDYIYVCIASGTIKRATLNNF